MLKLILYTFIALLGFSSSLFSQPIHDAPEDTETAVRQIRELRKGTLLVMLKVQEKKVQALRSHGYEKEAKNLERDQAIYNQKLIMAFRKEFKFCKYLFFMSNNAQKVSEKKFEPGLFVNDKLESDTTIKFSGGNYYIAEIGTIEKDTLSNAGDVMGFPALLIMSDKFIQLRRPFPYYVRTFDGLPLKRPLVKVVAKMNYELELFYEKNR